MRPQPAVPPWAAQYGRVLRHDQTVVEQFTEHYPNGAQRQVQMRGDLRDGHREPVHPGNRDVFWPEPDCGGGRRMLRYLPIRVTRTAISYAMRPTSGAAAGRGRIGWRRVPDHAAS